MLSERLCAYVRVYQETVERVQHVSNLEYKVSGLQWRRRVLGHVATEHSHAPKLRDALREVGLEFRTFWVHVTPDEDF